MKSPVFISIRRLTLPKGSDPKGFQSTLQSTLSQRLGLQSSPIRADPQTSRSAQRTADAIYRNSGGHLRDD
ncbi:MAG: hypothetical protein ABJ370_04850 [Paracoccaceae bacterium]